MDIIIIGAGAAGLMAARILSAEGKKVLVLEARERIGGRIHTNENTFTSKAETGAEFIHGNLKLTKQLLKEAGLKQTKVNGGIYRVKKGAFEEEKDFIDGWSTLINRLKQLKIDITIKEFLDVYMPEEKHKKIKKSFIKYVEGYDAADIDFASAISVRDEMEEEENAQYRIDKGYGALINFLAKEIAKNGSEIKISEIVKEIKWKKDNVEVITNNKTYKSQKVVITVPLGVLQTKEYYKASIKFSPGIVQQQKAINDLGFGGVIKILIEFDEAFWFDETFLNNRNIDKPFFIFADTFIPTWWTPYPEKKPLLTGWLAGPDSFKYADLSQEEFVEKSISSLAEIFKINPADLRKKLMTYKIYNWCSDQFCRGGYSYQTVGSKNAIKFLKKPVSETIYFAGEAFAEQGTATVDSALQSGQEVAHKILTK